MVRFAKLFEFGKNQVLVLKGRNQDEGEDYQMTVITRDEFVGEMQRIQDYFSEDAMNADFDSFREEEARQFVSDMEKAIGDLYGKNSR